MVSGSPRSPSWVVPGGFSPYDQPCAVTTGDVVEGLEHHHESVGVIEFELEGVAQQLLAFTGRDGGLRPIHRFDQRRHDMRCVPGSVAHHRLEFRSARLAARLERAARPLVDIDLTGRLT